MFFYLFFFFFLFYYFVFFIFFFFQAEDGIRAFHVTGVQTCALPIWSVASAFTVAAGGSAASTIIWTSTRHMLRSAARSGSSTVLSAASRRRSASINGSSRSLNEPGSAQVTSWTVRYLTAIPPRPPLLCPSRLLVVTGRVSAGVVRVGRCQLDCLPVLPARAPHLVVPLASLDAPALTRGLFPDGRQVFALVAHGGGPAIECRWQIVVDA